MPDNIGNKAAHDYHLDVPAPEQGFFAKGLGHGDWGEEPPLPHFQSQERQHGDAGL